MDRRVNGAPWLDRTRTFTARLLDWRMNQRRLALIGLAGRDEIVGTIWRWNYADVLTRQEAEHWDLNVLPMGWSIIRDDRRRV
jgi:hypothetical protein